MPLNKEQKELLTVDFILKVESLHKRYNGTDMPMSILPAMQNILDVYHSHFIPRPRKLNHYGFSMTFIRTVLDFFMNLKPEIDALRQLDQTQH